MAYDTDPSSARILELCEEIFDCSRFRDAGTKVLAPIGRFLNAGSMAMLQYRWNKGTPYIGHSATHAVDPHYHQLYNTHYFRQDPVVDRARPTNIYYDRCAGGQIEIFTLSDISDYRELERTPYYNEFFRPIQVHHVLALCYRSHATPDQVIGVGFHRPSNAPAFDHTDIRRARQIAAPLLTKIRSLMIQEDHDRQAGVVNELASMTDDQGMLLLDEEGTLLFANDLIRRDLCVREAVGQRITPDTSPDVAHLLENCRTLPRPGQNATREATRLTLALSGKAPPLTVSARVLTGAADRLRFLITTEAGSVEGPFGEAIRAYGFTRREADIVHLLAEGLSNPEIGEELCISVRTVENHLRSIYAKAEVQSRTQLIGKLIRQT